MPDGLIRRADFYREVNKGDLLVADNAQRAKEIAERTPTIDAVEVVRCNDCTLHNKCTFESWFAVAGIKDGYCCMGKRRG